MYAKIIDNKTKKVSIAIGDDSAFYKSIGMREMEVEQGCDGEWYIKGYAPQKSLNELKAAKMAELKAERDHREQGVITYNDKSFDYDLKSVAKLNEARDVLLVDGGSQAWICADSSITTLTADDITEIKRLGKERSNDLHMQYAALKVYIAGLTDKEAVEAVTFDSEIDISAQINLS